MAVPDYCLFGDSWFTSLIPCTVCGWLAHATLTNTRRESPGKSLGVLASPGKVLEFFNQENGNPGESGLMGIIESCIITIIIIMTLK